MNAFARAGIARTVLAAAALLVSTVAWAGGPGAVRKQIESTMLVTGKIQLDTRGKVTTYSLDHEEKLPRGIVAFLAKAVPAWEFKPVVIDGRAVNAIASMNIRLVANRADDGNYLVKVRGASFGDEDVKPEEDVRSISMAPPNYPDSAARAGVAGSVYLLVKVGREGKVVDVVTEQVNLRWIASENEMTRWRKILADTSMRQARKWSFTPPSKGEAADDPFWVVRVPVVYSFEDPKTIAGRYGTWESYVPGPRQRDPWSDEDEGVAFSPDTLPAGGSYRAGSGLKLLTDLSEI
ncbi:energy transducer TonB [Lysobacter terrae]